MPDLIVKRTGLPEFVPPERLAKALASGLYEAPAGDQKVAVAVRPGLVGETTVENVDAAVARGAAPETEASFRGRERKARIEREQGGIVGTAKTIVETGLDEVSLGGFGAIGEAVGGDEYTEKRLERQEANPVAHNVTKVGTILGTTLATGGAGGVGRLAAKTPLGAVTKLGAKISKSGASAGKASRAARIAAGGAFEGGATGAGQSVQELVATDDPLTIERIASSLSSNVTTGLAIGAGANLAGAGLEKALRGAKKQLDKVATRATADGADVSADLAAMDAKGLRAAKKAEIERLDLERVTQKGERGAARTAELDAIEAGRVTERATLADEIRAFRSETKDQKLFLSTKGIKEDGAGVLGKRTLQADRELDRLLDNPKNLAKNPGRAEAALQKQEAALEEILARRDKLVAKYAADESGARLASLDAIPAALERNRALQAKIANLAKPPSSSKLADLDQADATFASSTRTSSRLDEIAAAHDNLAGVGQKGFGQQLAQGAVFSGVTGAVAALPIPGAAFVAPLIGGKAASLVSEKLFGAIGKGATEAAKRTSAAVGAFLDVSGKITPAAPVLATKVLGGVRYAPEKERPVQGTPIKDAALPELYSMRTAEIRSQVAIGPDGRPAMRIEARQRIADQLAPIAQVDPLLADRLEAQVARKIEFLASRLPRRPDMEAIQTGPDHWRPSDLEMRTWARYAAAAEDPGGIEERLADGSITPEDAETMREVYPERMAEITRQIMEQLPELRETLPYERRLALSMFADVAVDPSMDPAVLHVLQASFANEQGTEGGTQAPIAQPQFGSVKNQETTATQRREGA